MPDVAMGIGLIEHSPLAIEHGVMDGVAVNGMRCGSAQELVLKGSLAEVEDHKDTAEMRLPGVVFIPVALLETLDVSIGQIINALDLTGAQGGQADRVLFFGLADDLIEIGQVVALSVGLPVVLEAHQFCLVPARPGDEFEWPRTNGMVGGFVKV